MAYSKPTTSYFLMKFKYLLLIVPINFEICDTHRWLKAAVLTLSLKLTVMYVKLERSLPIHAKGNQCIQYWR